MKQEIIPFFGGQGSRALLTDRGGHEHRNNARTSPLTVWLMATCHAAFLNELQALKENNLHHAYAHLDNILIPDQLLSIPRVHAACPVLQGVVLCFRQLHTYIQHREDNTDTSISGVAAFCSGTIPAIVVASARDSEDFVRLSKEAVRLAFWIGVRVGELSARIAGEKWQDAPWSLSVNGLDVEDVQRTIASFNDKVVCITSVHFQGRTVLTQAIFLGVLPERFLRSQAVHCFHYHQSGSDRLRYITTQISIPVFAGICICARHPRLWPVSQWRAWPQHFTTSHVRCPTTKYFVS